MKIFSPLYLLAALGALGAATAASAQVDTSQWKCESCPYPKGTTGRVDAGVGYVSDSSQKFGDYTGLDNKGAYLVLDGAVSHRGDGGWFADVWGSDLGLDSRRLYGEAGRAGLYSVTFGYAEIPRHLTESARTPFLGSGGSVLTLPAGFPAGDTAGMPLAGTLQPIDTGFKYKRIDLGGSFIGGGPGWSANLSLRHDEREGTRPTSGSFLTTASQVVAPVNEKTDGAELTVAYATQQLQATVSYLFSSFRNDDSGLTWSNPFFPVVPGATAGQLGRAPDNQFQQLRGTAGYDISPTIRVTGEAAFGRMTQNDGFLAPTINTVLAPTVPPLPANSLDGQVDTFTANVRMTATPMQGLRLTASYDRDSRDNKTPLRSYPTVTTDMFVGTERTNTPFSFTLDRVKLIGDYSGGLPAGMRITGGGEYDMRERTYQEVVTTREYTLWGKVAAQPTEKLSTWLKYAYGWRDNSVYGTSYWFGYPENPRLRKFYLADRKRSMLEGRLDFAINEKVSLGLSADYADDDYNDSTVGLTSARSANVAVEIATVITERTQGRAYFQTQSIRSQQNGSEAFAVPDWTGRMRDKFDVLGVGLKHVAIPEKLEIGADFTLSRAKSEVAVDNALAAPPFPNARTKVEAFKLYGTYQLKDNLSLTGGYHYEHYDSTDWRLDGIAPATVSTLLAFGAQPANYTVHVLRVAMRYRF